MSSSVHPSGETLGFSGGQGLSSTLLLGNKAGSILYEYLINSDILQHTGMWYHALATSTW